MRVKYVWLIAVISLIILVGIAVQASTSSRSATDADSLPVPPRYINRMLPNGTGDVPTATVDTSPIDPQQQSYQLDLVLNNGVGTVAGRTYWLPLTDAPAATFFFHNRTLNSHTMTLLCLVDYAQVPCTPHLPTMRVTVGSGEYQSIGIQLPMLTLGMHVIHVVALADMPLPRQTAEDPEALREVILHSEGLTWSQRITVFAGDYTPPEPTSTSAFTPIAELGNMQGNLALFTTVAGITPTIDGVPHPNLRRTPSMEGDPIQVKAGEQVDLSLIAGYSESAAYFELAQRQGLDASHLPFAITAFLDDTQIPLTVDAPNAPLFGQIPTGNYALIPVSLIAPSEPGIYTFFVLYKEGPFAFHGKLVPQNSGIRYEYFPDLAPLRISHRVVIEVMP